MKNFITILAFSCYVVLGLSACSTSPFDDDKVFTPVVTKGSWVINKFMDGNNNQNPGFAAYDLVFDATGFVKATKNGMEVNGTWTESVSKNILMVFDNTDPLLNGLSKEWRVKTITISTVELTSMDRSVNERFTLQQK